MCKVNVRPNHQIEIKYHIEMTKNKVNKDI